MKAAVVKPQGVQLQDVPTPAPSASQVLVRVRAAFRWDEIREALDYMKANRHFGKLVMTLG